MALAAEQNAIDFRKLIRCFEYLDARYVSLSLRRESASNLLNALAAADDVIQSLAVDDGFVFDCLALQPISPKEFNYLESAQRRMQKRSAEAEMQERIEIVELFSIARKANLDRAPFIQACLERPDGSPFHYDATQIKALIEALRPAFRMKWNDWEDLKEPSLDALQLKSFWEVLFALAWANLNLAQYFVSKSEYAFTSAILFGSQENWLDRISQFSEIDRPAIERILNSLTQSGGESMYLRPIFKHSDGCLVISNTVILTSRFRQTLSEHFSE